MLFSTALTATLAAALVAGGALPALALDAEAFAAKVVENATKSAVRFTYQRVELNGDTVILKEFTVNAPDGKDFPIGDATFEGVSETGDGGYEVDRFSIPDINVVKPDDPTSNFSIAGMEITGLILPAEAAYSSLDGVAVYEGARTGPIKVVVEGKTVFEMSGIELALNRRDDDSGLDMTVEGTDVKISLADVKDPKVRDAVAKLGYEQLTGEMAMDIGWDVETGLLDMREYSFAFDDVGTLDMTLSFSGYTLKFVQAMQQAQQAMITNPDKKAAEQTYGITMLGMMQQLAFENASITFEDDSLTGRALDYAGQQQGVSGEQMGQALRGMMPLMLGQLGIPALQQQITAAATAYLDDPQSLTISAEPENPVPFPQIMGAGMGDPRTLVDLLGVTVTANE